MPPPTGISVEEIVAQVLSALEAQGVQLVRRTAGQPCPGPEPVRSTGGSAAESQPTRPDPVADSLTRTDLAKTSAAAGGDDGSPPSSVADDRFILRKRVITLNDIASLLPRVRYLVVPPRAVVSPAVLDELAQRSVTLVYADESESWQSSPAANGNSLIRLHIEVVSRRLKAAEIIDQLRREGILVSAEQGDCLVTASERLSRLLAEPTCLGAILTRHPSLAVCLANRHKVLRATWATSLGEMLENVADIGANVIVLDFRKHTVWQIIQILSRFIRLGPQNPPWQELLPAGP